MSLWRALLPLTYHVQVIGGDDIVEGFGIGATNQVFAIDMRANKEWVLSHVPSGAALSRGQSIPSLVKLATQLYWEADDAQWSTTSIDTLSTLLASLQGIRLGDL